MNNLAAGLELNDDLYKRAFFRFQVKQRNARSRHASAIEVQRPAINLTLNEIVKLELALNRGTELERKAVDKRLEDEVLGISQFHAVS